MNVMWFKIMGKANIKCPVVASATLVASATQKSFRIFSAQNVQFSYKLDLKCKLKVKCRNL